MTARRNQWGLVVAAGLATFLAQLDTTIVTVALPYLAEDLQAEVGTTQWVMLAYLVPVIALSLTSGQWVDRIGPGAALAVAVATFAVLSVAASAAPTVGLLVATLAPLGGMSGPALGGILVGQYGSRAIFLVGVPVAALILGLLRGHAAPRGPVPRLERRGLLGIALLGGAALTCLLALTPRDGGALTRWWLLPLGVALVLLWWRVGGASGLSTVLALPAMRTVHSAYVAVYLAVLTVQFLVPFFLGRQLSAAPGAIGMVMIAFPLTAALAGPVSGWAADRWSARAVAAAGATLLTVALAALAPLSVRWEAGTVAVLLAMVGVGFGLFLTANQALALAVVPDSRIGLATASTNLARVVGLAAGPAAATATWAATGYAISGMRLALVIAAAASGAAALALVLARVPGGLQQSSVRDRGPAPSSNPARSS